MTESNQIQPPSHRDQNTKDMFHNYTEKEMDKIAATICSYAYFRKRYKNINLEKVKYYLLDILQKNPNASSAFNKLLKMKIKKGKE